MNPARAGLWLLLAAFLPPAASAQGTLYTFIGTVRLLDGRGVPRAQVHLAKLYLEEDPLEEAAAELDACLAVSPNARDADKLRAVRARIDSHLGKP